MNSMFVEQEPLHYFTARQGPDSQTLLSQSLEQKKVEFLRKCKNDRKSNEILTPSEYQILNDKVIISKIDRDIPNYLPFDDDEKPDKQIRQYTTIISQKYRGNKKKGKKITIESLIFSPDNFGKVMWDMICMLLIFYEIIAIPFKISFNMDINQSFEYVVDAIFMFDILISFNTGVYVNGQLQMNHKLGFGLMFLHPFPYDYIINDIFAGDPTGDEGVQTTKTTNSNAKLISLLKFFRLIKIARLLRLAKLKMIFNRIEEFFQVSTTIITIVSFLQLSVFVLFWSHWLGCIFHFIGQNEDPNINWLVKFGLYDETWDVRYVNSIYWAVTTMTTVGYGDLSPQTPIERLFGVFFLLIACGVFSFTMNTIGNTMQQLSQKQDQYQKKISDINNYMGKVKLPKHLQNRVRKYLAYLWDSHRSIDLQSITVHLPQDLRYQITLEVVGTLISKYNVFMKTFHKKILIEISQIVNEQTFQPDEFIFQEDDSKNNENLYFIQEGQVQIMLMKTKQVVHNLGDKQIFGEINFFSQQPRTASAKSVNFTDLFVLKRSDMMKLFIRFPVDQEKFFQIQDEISKGEYHTLNIFCYSCEMQGHVVKDCPSLHFVVDPYTYFKAKAQCLKQMMRQYIRKDKVDFNARKHTRIIRVNAQEFNQNNPYNFIDETILDDVQYQTLDKQLIGRGMKLKSKFKEDQIRKKRISTFMKHQAQQVNILQQRQTQQLLFTKQLSKNISKPKGMTYMIDSDETSDQEFVNERFDQILKDYGQYKQEMNVYNGNQQAEDKQHFTSLNEFDKGQDFNLYNIHNNLSVVIKEVNKYNFGSEKQNNEENSIFEIKKEQIKPKIETEYDQNVLQEYLEYYLIEYDQIKRFNLGLKKSQLRQYLNYTKANQYAMQRQERKQQSLVIKPKIKFKTAVNAIKFGLKLKL
ncbi:hypothetical protein pb186bvf_011017 [Paramecium bursaria]